MKVVIPIEVRINKEVRDYQESIFFGLSLRQFLFALLAVLVAVGLYFGLSSLGPPQNRQILWGEEEGMEWAQSSPEAGTEQNGISSDEGSGEIGWICVLAAFPFALCGFFTYNGMTFEKFLLAVIRSELLYPRKLVFRAENLYAQAMEHSTVKEALKID